MITKENILHAVMELPDSASVEDAMERLFLLSKIDKGISQADRGETLSHQAVKDRLNKWVK